MLLDGVLKDLPSDGLASVWKKDGDVPEGNMPVKGRMAVGDVLVKDWMAGDGVDIDGMAKGWMAGADVAIDG